MINNVRNFSIIAHIDHGKTTLTDRFLEITKTVEKRLMHERFLDSHPISQERGVTIKLAPVRMLYELPDQLQKIFNFKFSILNLIDTPGHIDFAYEVSRSLAACEGAILLVDATQGIQAQTLAHFYLAKKQNLKIIPVVNKIDISYSQPEKTAQDLIDSLGFKKEEILFVSARTGENVKELLQEIVLRLPSPINSQPKPLRALIFNSVYHPYKGVIAYIRVVDGEIDLNKETHNHWLTLMSNNKNFEALEVGYFMPHLIKQVKIGNGEVGYLATGLKDISLVRVGDTITESKVKPSSRAQVEGSQKSKVFALHGYQEPKPMVFFNFYPSQNSDFKLLEEALEQLKLNDYALNYSAVGSPALGKGFRLGFLGVFHALITQERLERDYNLDIVITSPSVEYQIITKQEEILSVRHASELGDLAEIKEIREPWVNLHIFTPKEYLGNIFKISQDYRGVFINQQYFGSLVNLEYEFPLIELISGFYDKLKSASSGFASLDYTLLGFKPFKAVKLEVLIHREKIDALAMLIDKSKGEYTARIMAKKLKEVVPRQQFEVAIQVSLNNKIVARETIKSFRKDVTQKLYGGDQTRKDKLLKKQKKGKKRMKMVGQVNLPQEAFMAVLEVK